MKVWIQIFYLADPKNHISNCTNIEHVDYTIYHKIKKFKSGISMAIDGWKSNDGGTF